MITIKEKEHCTGCYACANICPKGCISMETDQEGFWYPEVDYSQCIECGRCINYMKDSTLEGVIGLLQDNHDVDILICPILHTYSEAGGVE